MQICGTWVNALGLLLNFMGVLILLFFAGGGTAVHSSRLSPGVYRFGLVLLLVGFLIQFLVAVCPLIVG
jgi:ABC-type uncharacterized transport system permease subunit